MAAAGEEGSAMQVLGKELGLVDMWSTRPAIGTGGVACCAVSPNGERIVAVRKLENNSFVDILDTAAGELVSRLSATGAGDHIDTLTWASNEKIIGLTKKDRIVEYNLINDKWELKFFESVPESSSWFIKNGLAALSCTSGLVHVIDCQSKYSTIQTIDLSPLKSTISTLSSDANLLAIGCEDGTLFVFSRRDNGLFEHLSKHLYRQSIENLVFNSNASHLAIGFEDESVILIPNPPPLKHDSRSSTTPRKLSQHCWHAATDFAGNDHVIAPPSESRTLCFWRAVDGACVGHIKTTEMILSVAYDPLTGLLFAGHNDGSLRCWYCPPSLLALSATKFCGARKRQALSRDIDDHVKKRMERMEIPANVRELYKEKCDLEEQMREVEAEMEVLRQRHAVLDSVHSSLPPTFRPLALHQSNAFKEMATCQSIINHVDHCASTSLSSLLPGVFFDEWLDKIGLSELCGRCDDMDGTRLLKMSIAEIEAYYGIDTEKATEIYAEARFQECGEGRGNGRAMFMRRKRQRERR